MEKLVENPSDLLVLCNKEYRLPKAYEPEDLYELPLCYAEEENICLRREAAFWFCWMVDQASKEGYRLFAASAYRSYERQKLVYENYVREDGRERADCYSARPGHSEHQTGLAVDVSNGILPYDSFEKTREALWVKDHSWQYGFIVRYTEEGRKITGYKKEPWHLRYLGETAELVWKSGKTLEEFLSSGDGKK